MHIAAIRKAFDPDRDLLNTTVGRGYRLVGTWKIRHVDAPAQVSAPAPVPSPSTNIPAATFDLVGRAAAIAHLTELLSAYRIVREHVVDAAAKLAETIVSRCPGTTILATSREALRIGGEHVYRVPALGVTTDHIGPGAGVGRDYCYFPGDGFGYGLGIAVRTDPGNAKPPPPGSIGELKWDSGNGTYFGVDPNST